MRLKLRTAVRGVGSPYTGKAMAGLVAHVRAGRIAAGSRVLFLHTGGLPALFAYADKLGSWLTKAPWAPPR